jgi:predicted RNA-binding Zn ribbon-like protein
VAAIAVAIAEAAASGTWVHLKRCPAPRCGQVFYDDPASPASQRCPAHTPLLSTA